MKPSREDHILSVSEPDFILNHGMRKLSVSEVAEGLKHGDESILGYIYSQHVRALYRFGNQLSKDKDLVKDCIQDVFAQLVKNPKALREVTSMKSYLFKSLSRAIIEKSKKSRKYLLNHSALDVIEGFGLEISLETKMIDEEAYKMKVQQVNAELSKLSARQRQALVLYYIDGFTQQEIADIMQLKDQHSVTKLVKRALDSIRGNVGVLLFFATEFYDFR